MSVAQDTAFLVFAYLKKERCSQTAASFLTESPSIHQNHLTIDSDSALSLTEIVAEYLELKQKGLAASPFPFYSFFSLELS